MNTLGTHLLAEFRGCDPSKLNDLDWIEQSMCTAAIAAGATIINRSFHQFGPHGVSGVLVLAESHLSVHTWPEHQYAATDIYTCGDHCNPKLAHDSLRSALGATSVEVLQIQRGIHAATSKVGSDLQVVQHNPLPLYSNVELNDINT